MPFIPSTRYCRLPKLAALGLQHVLVMYANAVAVPLIIGGALHLPKDQIALLINARSLRLRHRDPDPDDRRRARSASGCRSSWA